MSRYRVLIVGWWVLSFGGSLVLSLLVRLWEGFGLLRLVVFDFLRYWIWRRGEGRSGCRMLVLIFGSGMRRTWLLRVLNECMHNTTDLACGRFSFRLVTKTISIRVLLSVSSGLNRCLVVGF